MRDARADDAGNRVAFGRRASIAAAGVVVSLAACLTVGVATGQEGSRCASYATYRAAAGAAGIYTLQSAPGTIPEIATLDAWVPGAEALVASPGGSNAWAAAAYGGAVGALGTAQIDPNQVPIFATSSYPTKPEISSSLPGSDVTAKSTEESSSARSVSGSPPIEFGSAGQISTSVASSCAGDGTVRSVARTTINAVEIKDVLGIGSITAHAEAVVEPSGKPKLTGSIAIDGATILGQRVAISDRGLELAGSTVPLPENLLLDALRDAGISVRTLAPVMDADSGSVTAPALEIVVTGAASGLGSDPLTSTFTFGRAYATAEVVPEDEVPGDEVPGDEAPDVDSVDPPLEPLDEQIGDGSVAAPPLPELGPTGPTGAAPSVGEGSLRPVASARLDDISYSAAYAVAVGVFLLLVLSLLFKRVGVRVRWR